jgi:hypothetical protein
MKEVFRRGSYADDLYDEPGWPAVLTTLAHGRYRLDALRAGLRLIEEALKQDDHARARELALGLAAALDARLEPLPDGTRYFMTDLRRSARGFRRQTFYTLEELLRTLHHLVACEAWGASRERRPDLVVSPDDVDRLQP